MPAILGSKIDRETYLELRGEYIGRIRGIDPEKPAPDPRIRMNAIRAMEQQEQQIYGSRPGGAAQGAGGTVGPLAPSTWTELGPSPIPNGQTSPSVPVSGRVTAIAVHPTNPNTIYVGAAQGGVFRSLDGGATWTPLMDSAQSLGIGAITVDPVSPSTVFVGTGEGNASLDSHFGVGIYRIDNADTSPVLSGPFETRIAGTGTLAGNGHAFINTSITSIVVDPANDNRIYIANTVGGSGLNAFSSCCGGTNPPSGLIGLYFSNNALAATPQFSFVANSPGGGVGGLTDLAFEPGSSSNLLIAVKDFSGGAPGSGVWRTTNATNAPATSPTFTQTLNLSGQRVNIKLAINKVSTTVTVLAGSGEGNGTLRESTDGGATWPTTIGAAAGFCGGQCFYDLVVTLKPDDANTFFLGGSAGSANPGASSLKKTINGGTSFTIPNASLHADTHAIVYAPSNFTVMYEGNDGGIWRSSDGGNTWTSRNTAGFMATQFQSLALHPSDREFMIGGTQDNGTEFRKPDATWTRADFGDGGYSLIDQNAADTTNVTMYHTYFNQANNLVGYAVVTGVANAHDNGWGFSGCGDGVTPANGITCGDTVLFYAPMARGPGSPNTVYYGTDHLYRSADGGNNNTVVSQNPIVGGVPISTIAISPQNDNVRIVGLRNGKLFATTTGSSTLSDITGSVPAHYVARAIIDPNNQNTAYVTLDDYGFAAGQHVWKTTNLNGAPPTWTASGNGIPDVPTNAIVIDPTDSTSLYVGTDIGVYHSSDTGATWTPYGTGLPRIAVFDLAIQSPNRVLRAATHGRGLWEISIATTLPPSIAKAFGAGSIPFGASTSLTFTINNPNASQSLSGLAFTDTLPGGLVVATPNGLSNTCGGTATATAGSSSVSLSAGTLAASASCTVSANVTGTSAGTKNNSVTVTSTEGGTGNTSTANLTVVAPPTITKAFGATNITPNSSTSLTFTITNPAVNTTAENGLAFTDTLQTGLQVASPNGLSNTCGGTVTATPGTTNISLAGGSIATPGATCTIVVNVTATTDNLYMNTTGPVSSTNGGTGAVSNTANLTVAAPPTFTKAFVPTSIPLASTSTLTFTINNPNVSVRLTVIGFTDSLPPGLTAPNGSSHVCDATAPGMITIASNVITVSTASVAPSNSCTINVTVTGATPGTKNNVTSNVTSTEGGMGTTAQATLTVVAPPTIAKAFGASGIPLNGTTTLTFTITNPAANTSAESGIAFTDTLTNGLQVAATPGVTNNCGGTVTATAGSTSISLAGGGIPAPGGTCTVLVNVTGTQPGNDPNTTGAVSSTNGGTGTASNTANLAVVAPPTLSKAFNPTSIPLNATSLLTFTVTNPAANTTALTGVAFTDTLPVGLTVATNTFNNCSGGTVTTTAPRTISLSGGSIATNSQCTFGVTVTGAVAGSYSNIVNGAGTITSTNGGTGVASNTAPLTVVSPPTISKSFGAPRIAIGGTAVLTFTVNNPNTGTPLTGVAFSDTLPAGLVINTPNGLSGSCGGGTITATQGTSVISLSGATLPASTGCTFSVNVLGTAGGDQNNTTGNVSSIEGGTGLTASATINVIAPPTLNLAFNPTSIPQNGTTSLQFTITNPAVNTTALNGGAFTDTLPAGLTVPSSSSTVCGGTLTTTNPTTIQLSGATVNQNSQCIFSVTVTGAAAGSFSNIVSGAGSITSTTNGIGATGPPSNTVNLTVVAPPTIGKAFGAASITLNGTTSLTFTITNPAGNTTSENGIAFADTLSAGLQVASPNGLTNNCGGTATAVAGSTSISLSGGSIATPGANCTIVVNITGTATGIYTNTTGPISSTNGGTGTTSNTAGLTVALPPSISKMFGASGITVGGSTSLSFTINNSNTNVPLTGIAFNDPLPAGLVVSTPNGQTGSCGAGTITAIAGSGSISLTVGTLPSSGSCTFSVNVTGTTTGTKNNITGNVTSNEGGNGNMAAASINVNTGTNDIALTTLTHAPDPVAFGGRLIFTATVTAIGPSTATVSFTETFAGKGYVVSANASPQGSCSFTASVTCNLGQMTGIPATPQVATVTVTLTPLLGNSIQATGTVTSDITNPDPNTTKMDTGRVRIKARSRK